MRLWAYGDLVCPAYRLPTQLLHVRGLQEALCGDGPPTAGALVVALSWRGPLPFKAGPTIEEVDTGHREWTYKS